MADQVRCLPRPLIRTLLLLSLKRGIRMFGSRWYWCPRTRSVGPESQTGKLISTPALGLSIGRVEPPVDGPRTRLMEKTPRGAKSSRWNFLLPGSGHSLSPSSRQARPSSARRFSRFQSCLKISSRMTSFSLMAGMRRFLLCGFAPESGSSSSKLMGGETGLFNYGRGRRELQGGR